MSALVKCQLILQAADQALPPNSPPTPGLYPNRLILDVPGELAPLLQLTRTDYQVPSSSSGECRTLADNLVRTLGPGWSAGTAVYSYGSVERSGEWIPGSGYSFQIFKGGNVYERGLAGVGSSSTCKFLFHVQHLSNLP